jgi:hypothetical protein
MAINQDLLLDKRQFATKGEAQKWASRIKAENKLMGVVRHSIKEVLHNNTVKWEASVYTREKKKK